MPAPLPEAPADALVFWLIYDHPRDLPDYYVLRRDFLLPGGVLVKDPTRLLSRDVEKLRAFLPAGAIRYPVPDPDPVIMEVWI